jgi:hypothetical protein
MLIKNCLHQLGCSWHPVCRTSFAGRTEISSFSRTLLRHFRRTISDATGAQSEVTYFLGGDEVLLTIFGAIKSSITRIALVCRSGVHPNVVCERPGSCDRRAIFIGDELAILGSACSCAPAGQGVMVALVQ